MARKRTEDARRRGKVEVDPYAVAGVSPSYMMFQEAYGICGEDYVRPLNVTKFPFKIPIGWGASYVGSKSLHAPVALVLDPISGDRLNAQINRTVNMATPQMGDGMLTYTERAQKRFQAENAEQINAMLLNENARLFDVTVYAVLRGDSPDELKREKDYFDDLVSNTTRARAEKQLSNTQAAFFAASPCVMPDEAARLAYSVPMPAETVAMAELSQSYGFDDAEGVLLGSDNNGGAVRLDFHTHGEARPNGNIACIAESGNGKSTLIKHITVNEHLLYDTNLVVASDPDSEYGHACLAFGGEITDPIKKISPFEPRNVSNLEAGESDEGDGEAAEFSARALRERVLSNHIPFLKTFLQMAFPLIDDNTASYLGAPIAKIYGDYGVEPDTTFAEYYARGLEFPVMEDLYLELRAEADQAAAEGMGLKAEALTRASQAIEDAAVGYDRGNWNTRERFESNAKFVVVDTSGLSSDEAVRSAQLYNILMWAWSRVRSHRFSNNAYTRIVMDELNSIVNPQNLKATAQIADMMRRVRKYNAGMFIACQVINSLLGDESIRTNGTIILDNCVYKFFGSQTGKAAGQNLWQAQQYLTLTDNVRDQLGQAGRGKFIATIGKHDKTWVNVDAVEDWEFKLFGRGGGL